MYVCLCGYGCAVDEAHFLPVSVSLWLFCRSLFPVTSSSEEDAWPAVAACCCFRYIIMSAVFCDWLDQDWCWLIKNQTVKTVVIEWLWRSQMGFFYFFISFSIGIITSWILYFFLIGRTKDIPLGLVSSLGAWIVVWILTCNSS